jgi:diguanylate cyclase (GGDEF)-like protein
MEKISSISDHYQAGLKSSNARLEEVANTDLLTGLSNRRDMLERLQSELQRAQRSEPHTFSILLVDIDHFKSINDRFGHLAGDQVLTNVAKALSSMLRAYDSCARWGGEEFLLLLPDTEHDGALAIAERLRQMISETAFNVLEQTASITISIGGLCYEPGQTLDEMMQLADTMLYSAKEHGRNGVKFCIG